MIDLGAQVDELRGRVQALEAEVARLRKDGQERAALLSPAPDVPALGADARATLHLPRKERH